jgi:Na+/H+ antiporter NhaD/arsenite permease-like protein
MMLLAASAVAQPSPWMVLPFAALLLCIALMPLLAHHFWEQHYPKISVALGGITAAYYLFGLGASHAVLHSLMEYISFMALVGSLYVISGGINIRVKGSATPAINVLFLLIGSFIANIIGTTGASMLLIRPWIRMNKYRITQYHIAFFIFLVSNVGGCLTPIGDPPLFLGFLRGVPFWWVAEKAWPAWLLVVGLLLAVFYVIDTLDFRRAPKEVREKETAHEEWSFRGARNVLFIACVLIGVFLPQSWRIGTDAFHITIGSLLMFVAATVSYFTTPAPIHEANDFNFHPVQEVGWLFIGIFMTMLPALDLLQSGSVVPIETPMSTYFACGMLSAFLDNAPTYLAFLAAGMGSHHLSVGSPADVATFLDHDALFVLAISLGAVFFGAGSYIGNGPNFMVKAIAEKAGVKAPHFLEYILRFSLPILLPVLAFAGWFMLVRGR